MQLTFLKSKIHRARVTSADLNYEGSISIDKELLDKSSIMEYEQVDVVNISNGERFTTYTISEKRNSGVIQVNGAAARKVQSGDLIIIMSYCILDSLETQNFKPKIVLVNEDNKIL